MRASLGTAIRVWCLFVLLTGFLYPVCVTMVATQWFSWKSKGSLIYVDERIVGSFLLGQYFNDPAYFWGRPSATPVRPYNTELSSGSNIAPSNPKLLQMVDQYVSALQKHPNNQDLIPVDLVTTSASGLDPDISPEAARYQVHRIAKIRKIKEEDLLLLIQSNTKDRYFGFLGEPRVNVLLLNLKLDDIKIPRRRK